MTMGDLWYSFGMASAGAVCLHNYPNALRSLTRIDGQITDLATLDIVRDRERGVPRYNDFREALRMPRSQAFEELTPNKQWAKEIAEIYNGDIDARRPAGRHVRRAAAEGLRLLRHRVPDLHPDGVAAAQERPVLHHATSARRSTPRSASTGCNDTTMKDVLLRHYPELEPVIGDVERVFAPWPELGAAEPGQEAGHRCGPPTR